MGVSYECYAVSGPVAGDSKKIVTNPESPSVRRTQGDSVSY